LQIEKNASPYTIKHYLHDLETFVNFLNDHEITHLHDVDFRVVRLFLTHLYDKHLSRRSVSRKISSIKSFYKFLGRENEHLTNPRSEERRVGKEYRSGRTWKQDR